MFRGGKTNKLALGLALLAASLTLQCRPAPKDEKAKIIHIHMLSNGEVLIDGKKVTRATFDKLISESGKKNIETQITWDEPSGDSYMKRILEDSRRQGTTATHIGFSGIIEIPEPKKNDKKPAQPQEKKTP